MIVFLGLVILEHSQSCKPENQFVIMRKNLWNCTSLTQSWLSLVKINKKLNSWITHGHTSSPTVQSFIWKSSYLDFRSSLLFAFNVLLSWTVVSGLWQAALVVTLSFPSVIFFSTLLTCFVLENWAMFCILMLKESLWKNKPLLQQA